MTLSTSVGVEAEAPADTLTSSELAGLLDWQHAFPSPQMIGSAAALLTPLRRWDGSEGARARLTIGPGMVQIGKHDPARAERTYDRTREAAWKDAQLRASDHLLEDRLEQTDERLAALSALANADLTGWDAVESTGEWADHLRERIERRDAEHEPTAPRITSWSARSRARMVRVLAELDYAPLFVTGEVPAMVTLTYPGEWLSVAPSAGVCKGHMDALAKRFKRAYGRPLVCVWKREFQRRGAPHYHLLMTPPREVVNGENFGEWLARNWVEIVGHPDPAVRADMLAVARHPRTVDYGEGMRARDPKRLAVYFSKHGSFSAKDYQNDAPAEWVASGSVGRFWGFWGLEKATVTVEVTPVEAAAVARTLRRWQEANGYRVQREVWRTNTRTGVMRKRKSGTWSGARMRGALGFVVCNDGASFGASLARYLDQVRERAQEAEIAAWLASPQRFRERDEQVSVRLSCRICGGRLSPDLAERGKHVGDECWKG